MDNKKIKKTRHCLGICSFSMLLLSLSIPSLPAYGFESMEELAHVSNTELAHMRGGFAVNGMEISFGVENLTFINGIQQESASIHGNSNSNLIQQGAGNSLSSEAFRSAAGVFNVIQNSLDSQVIQHLTLLNIDIRHMDTYRQQVQMLPMLNQQGLNIPVR